MAAVDLDGQASGYEHLVELYLARERLLMARGPGAARFELGYINGQVDETCRQNSFTREDRKRAVADAIERFETNLAA
jgi:hypothetical protein